MTVKLAWKIASENFFAFACKAFEIGNPATPFEDNWHLRAMAYQLERMRTGECRRLIITVPPRSLKSTMVSVAWPAFLLGRNPARQNYRHELRRNARRKALDRHARRDEQRVL